MPAARIAPNRRPVLQCSPAHPRHRIRISECTHLPLDCLQQVGTDQWALYVPLGKLHSERLVPADPEVRRIIGRLLALRTSGSPAQLSKSQGFLLPRYGDNYSLEKTFRVALVESA